LLGAPRRFALHRASLHIGVRGLLGLGVCVLQLLVAHRAWAAAELHDGRNALAAHAFVLEDDTGKLTIEDAQGPAARRFRPLRGAENAGHSRSAYWLRFQVKNLTSWSSFIVELNMTPEIVELYDDAGLVGRSGSSLPFGERGVAHPNIAFRIMLAHGEVRTLWLRQRSSDTIVLDPRIWPERTFWEASSREQLLNGLYYGALIALAMYNLFLFFGTRDRSYFLYFAFQVTNALTQASLDKYTFQYLWPGHPIWAARSVPVLEFLSITAALAFARTFLATRRLSPRLDAVMRVLSIAGLVFATVWTLPEADARITLIVAMLGAVHYLGSIVIIAVAATVVAARTGSTNARVFVAAWAVLVAATVMAVLEVMGILVSQDGFPLTKLGSAVEAVLLSLALASRLNGLMRDRERAQCELLAAKTARIDALRRLVSGVAHEVGNPLNFARGGADELATELDAIERNLPGGGAAVRRAHKLVASGLARIKLILDNLRRYLSVGDAELVPTDLAHEIDQALQLTAERLRCAGVRVEQQISDSLPPVRARPGQLHQVALNIITNAIEAMPGGGTLCVAARAGEHEVVVSMTDTGAGVDVADREQIFEPFFTTREQTGGTGLGLAVAREIVMRHGGTIRVEAGDRGGARFVVSLPRLGEADDR
jgi:signal transduction histidine kinase